MKKLILIAGAVLAVLVVAHAADPDTITREAWRVQVDTNATTTITLYTATKAGSLLSGKVGGSNAVWIATATGTNAWVKIAQTAP